MVRRRCGCRRAGGARTAWKMPVAGGAGAAGRQSATGSSGRLSDQITHTARPIMSSDHHG
jgi:hypothetical protein